MPKSDCYKECGRATGGFGVVDFQHKGLDFHFWRPGIVCDQCAQAEFLEEFERHGCSELVSLGDEREVVVDWRLYVATDSEARSDVFDTALMALGILTASKEGNWAIMGGNLGLCPSVGMAPAFFTRRDDVIAYSGLMYARVQYPWCIFQIGKVLSGEDVAGAFTSTPPAVSSGAE